MTGVLHRLGDCLLYVSASGDYAATHFRDGALVEARAHLTGAPWCSPEQADAYAATATALGYTTDDDDLNRMAVDHDLLHTYASVVLLGKRESPTLRFAASGTLAHETRHHDAVGYEERLVQALQLWRNTGRETEPLSALWFVGYAPERLGHALDAWLRYEEGWRVADGASRGPVAP